MEIHVIAHNIAHKILFVKAAALALATFLLGLFAIFGTYPAPTFANSVTVSGIVFKPDGVTVAPNVWVQLHSFDWSYNTGGNTNESGVYTISGQSGYVPDGTYTVEATPPFNNTDGLMSNSIQVSVAGSSLTGQNIVFKQATKTLTGKVTRKGSGAAVAGAMVNANKPGAFVNTQTAADGTFTLKTSGGNWMVMVNPDMAPNAPAADWAYIDQPQQVTFNDNDVAESKAVNFEVVNATAKVTGTVKKADGTVITQGHVDVRSPDGRGSGRPVNSDGTFSINVPAGGYDISVHLGMGGPGSEGSQFSVPRQHIDIADNQTVVLDLVAKERTAKIIGRITDKNGNPVKDIEMNASQDTQGGGPGDFTSSKTDASGNFTLFVLSGRWHVHMNQGPQSPPYVYDGQPMDANISSDTAVVDVGTLQVANVDAKITGRILSETGEALGNFPGYAFARPTGAGGPNQPGPFREFGGPVMNGQFTIQLPSTGITTVTIGIHTPPDSDYGSATDQTVEIVPNGTVTKDIVLVKNNARVWGRILDASGFPLSSCNFRGDAFLNSYNGVWRGSQIKADCSYSISITPGTYQFGYHIDDSSGFMNRPPAPDPITISANDSIERNIKVVAGDATISGKVLDPNGNPVPNVFVFADNHEEIDNFRHEAGSGPGGPANGPELAGLDRKGPGGSENPEQIFKYCSDSKHAKECKDFKLPPGSKGPGGCSNAFDCTNYCKTHKTECFGQAANMKPPTGPGQDFVGPGGCKTETECKAFCSKPENFEQCHQFGPPPGDPNLQPQSTGATQKFSSDKGPEDIFDKMIHSGAQTDASGNFSIKTLSGHKYSVGAGLPPESKFMPAKFQKVDLTKSKSAFVTVQLRSADAKITGKVTKNGQPVQNGFVHAWAEDGGFSGTPVINGTYSLNVSSGTVWHIGADSPDGRDLYRSEEVPVVIGNEKVVTRNFAVKKSIFIVPKPVSETFDASETKVITLEDGTSITIPSGAIDDSGSVTVTATPTVDVNSSKSSKPVGVGYELEARDADGNQVKKFSSNVTIKFSYTDKQMSEAGLNEESLSSSFYDTSSNSWERVTNATQDSNNNTMSIQTDHFSAYALTDTSGQARGKVTKQISVGKNSKGIATVTVGTGSSKKTITPFAGYKGAVQAKTANLGGKIGQVVAIAPSARSSFASEVVIYNTAGKKVKSLKPFGSFYRNGMEVLFQDLTGDGKEDIAMSTLSGAAKVQVYDYAKNSAKNITVGGTGSVNIESLEAFTKGVGALTTVKKLGKTNTVKVYKYNSAKSTFDWQKTFDTAKRVSVAADGTISLVTPKPAVKKLSAAVTYSSDANKTIKVTATGENFSKDTSVLVAGVIPVAVKYKSATSLELTIKPSKFQKGKTYDLLIVGADGAKSVAKKALTVK